MSTTTAPVCAPANRAALCDAAHVNRFVLGDWDRDSAKWTSKKITLVSGKTGQHYTYQLARPPGTDDGRGWLVKVLAGPDNTADYLYLGMLYPRLDAAKAYVEGVAFRRTAKSSLPAEAPAWRAFAYLTDRCLNGGELPPRLQVWHEGRCGRCGRSLTTPESIALGIGPTCAERMGIAAPKAAQGPAEAADGAADPGAPMPPGLAYWTADEAAECLDYQAHLSRADADVLSSTLWRIANEALNPTPLGGDGSDGTVETPDGRLSLDNDDKAGHWWHRLAPRFQRALAAAVADDDA